MLIRSLTLCFLLLPFLLSAQDTLSGEENIDYSLYGDAGGVKRFVTQKVVNQTPSRIVSFGYEMQSAFLMPGIPAGEMLPALSDDSVRQVGGLRFQVNIPVISNDRIIWQMGASYWGSRFQFGSQVLNAQIRQLEAQGLKSIGINSTVFKPLNEKHFLIFQASVDANAAFSSDQSFSDRSLTFSGTAIYGWKKSDRNMLGTGLARTYRAGRLMYVPVLFWNKTFSDQWGMELLLPARGHLRRNFSTTSMLQLGYELEGNQYYIPVGERYLQRGELKPRLQWDQKISGFFWLQLQAGMRVNWRFDMMKEYDASKDAQRLFTTALGTPFYFGISLNFVSP